MNLNKETQKIILIVAGVVAGIGPLLLIIGQLIKVFSILSSPIGIIVLAIAGITAAILYLYKTNKTFANFVLNAWEKIKTAFQFVGDIIKSVIEGDISKAIGQFEDLLFGVTMISEEKIMAIGDFLHRLKNVFIEIFEFIKVIIEENFIPVFEKIFEVVETVFNSVKETITAILPEVLEFIKNILGSILLFWETHGEKIMTFVSFYFNVIRNIFVFVLNVLKTTVTFVFDFIRIYIVTALQVIAKFVQFWVAIFTGDWSGAFEKIKEIFAIIWDAVKQILVVVLEFLKNLFLDFAEYLKSQWELIRESVISIVNKIKDKIIEIWTNISNFLTETFENIKTKTLELWNSIEKYVILIAGIITGLFIPKLVMLGISATVNAAKVVAAWVVMAVQATTSAIITTVTAIPSIIAGFIRMAIASTINALKVVASWVMTSVAAVANVAIMVTQSAVMVAKWVMMGTQSLIQAARMAAAWIIAMGPIAWITAAIIGFALLIIMNWEKIKEMTIKIYTAISDKIKEIWKSIIESIKTVINNIVTFIRDKFNSIRDTLFGIMGAIGSKIKETFNNIVTDIKNSINKVIDLVNGVISKFNGIRINIPKVEIPEVKILGFETPAFSVGGQSFGVPQIPSIPRLAEGGIINKPTLAMIGEGGESEAVIPLSKLAGLSGNNQTHIYLDGKEITRAVAPQMVDMLRAKLAY
jgi:phage-related protein